VTATVVAVPAAASTTSTGVPWTVVAAGSRLGGGVGDSAYLVRTRVATSALSNVVRPADAERLAAVDLARYAVVAIVAPFPECGWSIRMRALERSGARLRVSFSPQPPARGVLVCQAETRAYVVLRVARSQVAGLVRAVPVRSQ
jgi:hypothetical protein